MKRLLTVLAVAALMAVMLVAMAAPVFAQDGNRYRCHKPGTGGSVVVNQGQAFQLQQEGYRCKKI